MNIKGMMHYWQEVLKVMEITEASNSQLPLEPLANSDIPLVVIIDLLLLKNITKTASNGSKLPVMIITGSF